MAFEERKTAKMLASGIDARSGLPVHSLYTDGHDRAAGQPARRCRRARVRSARHRHSDVDVRGSDGLCDAHLSAPSSAADRPRPAQSHRRWYMSTDRCSIRRWPIPEKPDAATTRQGVRIISIPAASWNDDGRARALLQRDARRSLRRSPWCRCAGGSVRCGSMKRGCLGSALRRICRR